MLSHILIQQPTTVAQGLNQLFGLVLSCAPLSEPGRKLAFEELHGSSKINHQLWGKASDRKYRATTLSVSDDRDITISKNCSFCLWVGLRDRKYNNYSYSMSKVLNNNFVHFNSHAQSITNHISLKISSPQMRISIMWES